MNKAQRELKQEVIGTMPDIDKITCRADGTVELRRNYFYRHGMTSQEFGGLVAESLLTGWKVVRTRDEFRTWPQNSYFLAVVAQVVETG